MARKKVQVGGPITISSAPGAVHPDPVARIGKVNFEDTGDVTVHVYFFNTEEDAENGTVLPITTRQYTNNFPGLEQQILDYIKTQGGFELSSDIA